MNGHTDKPREISVYERHYLSKMLAHLEMSREWQTLGEVGICATYKEPFLPEIMVPNKKLAKQHWDLPTDKNPVLKFMFNFFLLNFPGLSTAPRKYWTKVVQPCLDDISSRNLSDSKERSEITKRRILGIFLNNYIGTIFHVGIRHLGEEEPFRPLAHMYEQVDDYFPAPQKEAIAGLFVFIPKADTVTIKKTNGKTTLYLIATRENEKEEQFVYRDYGTFQKFHADLTSEKPEGLPRLPTAISGAIVPRVKLQSYLRSVLKFLAKENNQSLLFKVKSFLLGFALDLPKQTLDEYKARVIKEEQLLAETHETWVRHGQRVQAQRDGWRYFIDTMLEGWGMEKALEVVGEHPSAYEVPAKYLRAIEWSRAYVAHILYHLLVVAPNAAEVFYILQVVHHLFPWGIARQMMKIANPAHMIRALFTLLLGGPVGTKSVFARIYAFMAGREIKQFTNQIKRLESAIDNEKVCLALKTWSKAPKSVQDVARKRSNDENVDIIMAILESPEADLVPSEISNVKDCYAEFMKGVQAGDTALISGRDEPSKTGPKADKFKSLKRLIRLYALKRGRKISIDVWSQSLETMIKSTMDLFLPAISALSKVSNLSDRFGDLKAAIDDLIDVVLFSQRTPYDFYACAERHEQSFYYAVHEVQTNGPDVWQPLLDFFRRGLDYMGVKKTTATGTKIKVDIDRVLESDPSLREPVLAEINNCAKFAMYSKLRFDIRIRSNLMGPKAKVDVDGILRSIMENEGDAHLIQTNATTGEIPYGYFYDGVVADSPNVVSLLGESFSTIDNNAKIDVVSGSLDEIPDNSSVTDSKPSARPSVRKGAVVLKTPILVETRKYLPAWLAQTQEPLLELYEQHQWKNPKDHK